MSAVEYAVEIAGNADPDASIPAGEVLLSAEVVSEFVQLKSDPSRFVPGIFQGDWSVQDSSPSPGKARFLRRLKCAEDLAWDIVRQGSRVFARRISSGG